MRHLRITLLLLATVAGLSTLGAVAPTEDAPSLVRKMVAKAKTIRTLKYTLYKWERIDGNMHHEKMFVKLQRSPFRIYVKQTTPRQVEVLWGVGYNNNKALVNAGSMVPNLSLDIDGSMLRENQHHNLTYSGFDNLASIFEHLVNKYGSNPQMARLEGVETVHGRVCYKVVFESQAFGFVNYTVLANENIFTIARKLKVSEHMILENNPSLSSYTGVPAGTVLKVPNDYGKKAFLWMDKTLLLPVKVMVYDHRGLYEHYEFINVEYNPVIPAVEFTSDYEGYGF